ncbi:lysozyme [Erythrobacteraceae bacterium CFH 75059]|uniref:lysozyme n=1 Tax=Qipengyuania thermophila TaxID=2509361 RepID=UPI0010225290|nr:lysozyme [Qipengyuania thermophila]TCD06201.1 lysozyme [Erythrobacteraceae bacterium CFH 75059]
MQRSIVFDTVRAILGRRLRAAEVRALDGALDRALHGGLRDSRSRDAPDHPPCAARQWTVSDRGVALVKRFEGCARRLADGRVAAYPDPGTGAEPWTIGWGATGPEIGPDTVWTQDQCDQRLAADLARYAAEVARALAGAATTQEQFDALVSFHYNTGAIGRATLTRKHREGDYAGAAAEFGRWTRAGGRVLRGLVRRRAAEAALYAAGTSQGPR